MHYETSAVINRPIEEVWALPTDSFNIPRFGRSILDLRKTSPGPTGVGAMWQGRINFLGSERPVIGVVTEWDPPRGGHFVRDGRGNGFGFHPPNSDVAADGTKVVRAIEVEPKGILKLIWPILVVSLRHVMKGDPERIKRFLEAGRG